MRRIFLFMNVSLDGYFEGPNKDISAFHGDFEAFSSGESAQVDTLLFGRKTYELMKGFWSTPQAAAFQPEIAKFMNENRKVVASHTPFAPGWTNASVISDDVVGKVRELKARPGKTIAMFGSNNLCVSLMQHGLIDEFQIVVNPVALGAGTPLFQGLPKQMSFALRETRQFKSGATMLTYAPAE